MSRILLERAEEQVADLDPRALAGRDAWAPPEAPRDEPCASSATPRRCIGCGKGRVQGWSCCPKRRKRVAAGLPTDLGEYVTDAEYRTLARRMPGVFVVGSLRSR